jgi:hypothetical protein
VKTLHIDPASGASGDMFLGMFVALGVPPKVISEAAGRVVGGEFALRTGKVRRAGLMGTRVEVVLQERRHGNGHGRRLDEILAAIKRARLGAATESRARSIFRHLAEVESRLHGLRPGEVRFHELGAVDTIVDVVGSCAALEALGVGRVTSSPVATGTGTVRCDHGELPVPSPATLELLRGVPTAPTSVEAELTTPTGAALLTGFVDEFGPPPAPVTVLAIGYGAGSRDLPGRPNLLRGTLYEGVRADARASGERMIQVEAVIDDMTGELAGELHETLAAAGAVEVTVAHVGAKKSRPAFRVSALCPPQSLDEVAGALFVNSTTIGARFWEVGRFVLDRESRTVSTRYGKVRLKLASMGGRVVNVAPEYEDCRRAARESGVPTKEVFAEAIRACAEPRGARRRR